MAWLVSLLLLLTLVCAGKTTANTKSNDPVSTSRFFDVQRSKLKAQGVSTHSKAVGGTYSFKPTVPFALMSQSASKRVVHEQGFELEFTAGLNSFFKKYSHHWPITDVMNQLTHQRTEKDFYNQYAYHAHFSQVHQGVPVYGSYLKVHTEGDAITHVNGQFVRGLDKINVVPSVTQATAIILALKETSALFPSATSLALQSVELVIYHSGLTTNTAAVPRLAFKVLIVDMTDKRSPVQEVVFVDAHATSTVLGHHSKIANALRRQMRQGTIDGPLIFDDEDPNNRVLPSTEEAANVLNFTSIVYDVFKNLAGRDSFDNAGSTMIAIYPIPDDGKPGQCLNAYFTTEPVPASYYCPGFGLFDITVHEWGHAYTEYSHGLVYQGQSGALNEAYSDILAESIQILYNYPKNYSSRGTFECVKSIQDGEDYRWIVGDQALVFTPFYPSGLRDMYNPNCGKKPRSTNDTFYVTGVQDSGGVHTNSGVPNQAFSLLADGGTLHDQVVRGIGVLKAYTIYLQAMLKFQGPTTNFKTHAQAIQDACASLIGHYTRSIFTGLNTTDQIVADDCAQIPKIVAATSLNVDPINSLDSLPVPQALAVFPLAIETYSTDVLQFVITLALDIISEEIECGWQGNQSCTTGCLNTGGVLAEEYTQLVVCDLPSEFNVTQETRHAITANMAANFSDVSVVHIFNRPLLTGIATVFVNNEQNVEFSGSGFATFTGCLPLANSTDILDRPLDCPACIFGDIITEFAVAATVVNSSRIRCPIPPLSALVNQTYLVRDLWVSLNLFTYYPYGTFTYTAPSPTKGPSSTTGSNSTTSARSSASHLSLSAFVAVIVSVLLFIL